METTPRLAVYPKKLSQSKEIGLPTHIQFIWLSEVLATLIWHVLILYKVRDETGSDNVDKTLSSLPESWVERRGDGACN